MRSSIVGWHGASGAAEKIAYSVAGKGPAIILLHPIGMDRSWWQPYIPHWSQSHRVVVIDLLGHGESAPVRRPIRLQDQARAVLEVIKAENIASATLVGVSMGGMVAQNVAIMAARQVRALVLCATAGAFAPASRAAVRSRGDTSRAGNMAEVIEATLARWFTSASPTELVEKCRATLAGNDWYSWSANWEAISELDNLAALSELRIPALVLAGDADASVPVEVARRLAESLRAEFVVLDHSPHFGAFESPDRFPLLIDRFLASSPD